MKYTAAYLSGPHDLKLKEVEQSVLKPDQVLVKVGAVGVCGSDIACYLGASKEGRYDIAPYVPGHEWAGEVVELGAEVTTLKERDMVAGLDTLPCDVCDNCKDGLNSAFCRNLRDGGFMPNTPGGMGEYLVIEEKHAHKLSEGMTLEQGALVEPCAMAYHGIAGEGGYVDASDDVVVFGAGPIGFFAAMVAKIVGAKVVVVEPIAFRRQMLTKTLGVDATVDPKTQDVAKTVMELTEGRGASLVVECSGTDAAISKTIEVAKHAGRVRFIGHSIGRKVPVEIGLAIWKGLALNGMVGAPNFFPRTIRFMTRARTKIDYTQVITHRFPLEKIQDAFDLAIGKKDETVKVMLTM